jgi:hypothetical protein
LYIPQARQFCPESSNADDDITVFKKVHHDKMPNILAIGLDRNSLEQTELPVIFTSFLEETERRPGHFPHWTGTLR